MSHQKTPSMLFFTAFTLIFTLVSCIPGSLNTPSNGPTVITPTPNSSTFITPTANGGTIGMRTKTSGCVSLNALPDPGCTPGMILTAATKEKVCVPGYSSGERDVTEAEKNQVYAEYGIKTHTTGEYEVDHLISLELGGSNDIANLWPEPAEPRPGFHEKDKVEDYLHKQVCDGAISLQDAQYKISHDWMAVYQNMPGK